MNAMPHKTQILTIGHSIHPMDRFLNLLQQQGVAQLLAIAGNRRTAIMCAEGLYWQCHRRLVSDYLLANGVSVQHIFPSGETKPHTGTPGAKIDSGTVTYPAPPTLFDVEDP
jgi:uncharacterized protein (DUF488 family)